jgi:hypothetical protein
MKRSRRTSPGAPAPRLGATRLGAAPLAALGAALLAVLLAACSTLPDSSAGSSQTTPTSPFNAFSATEQRALRQATASVRVALPTTPGQPAPTLGADAFGSGVGSHVVLGYLPSWEAASVSSIDYRALTEVAYYAVQVEPGGSILTSGDGWQRLGDGTASTLVADAHAVGTRALLTLFTQTDSTLSAYARTPLASGRALAEHAAVLCRQYGFDGVDLDLEGHNATDRHGFTRFVAAFSQRLRAIDSTYSIVLNTYPQSAVDPASPFDPTALAPYVDQLFVMAYDMSDLTVPGSASPLTGADLSDASTLASYVASVPRSKVILGIPFYGYDFTTSRRLPPAVTVGHPYPVSYGAVAAAGRPALWNPQTETPYSSFKRGRQWHETDFEDPTSVALKVSLAAAFRAGGVGVWELGMASGASGMTAALDGGSPPTRLPIARQP